ncbi:MAG: deoxyguanosinetriphosphate triphosphohydrolase [Deltaproteobacteria bacterium]|jgi:dGTPase|nr:deoxyguanosinetriphosphate triphosphohydrolase [Deltaproteobacteria bacterium]
MLSVRETIEERELEYLSPYSCPSVRTKGRTRQEEPCPIRTDFQRDRNRIVYCKAFRRLKYKTQVFLTPTGDHYRTRLTHTLEVSEIARTLGRALFLNEDLLEAIAHGHDLGHTPFGHAGEAVLNELMSGGFSHSRQSLRVVDVLENDGLGLNLTYEVRDGIINHSKGYGEVLPASGKGMPQTAEGCVVRYADIIAYLAHDLDDAIRSGVIAEADIPPSCQQILGKNHSRRIVSMVEGVLAGTAPLGDQLLFGVAAESGQAMQEMRQFLYHQVYRSEQVHAEFVKASKILRELFGYFMENPHFLDQYMGSYAESTSHERRVWDFVASMTDRYALDMYQKIFWPKTRV